MLPSLAVPSNITIATTIPILMKPGSEPSLLIKQPRSQEEKGAFGSVKKTARSNKQRLLIRTRWLTVSKDQGFDSVIDDFRIEYTEHERIHNPGPHRLDDIRVLGGCLNHPSALQKQRATSIPFSQLIRF